MESAREERKQAAACSQGEVSIYWPQWSPPEKSGSSIRESYYGWVLGELPQWSPPEKSGSRHRSGRYLPWQSRGAAMESAREERKQSAALAGAFVLFPAAMESAREERKQAEELDASGSLAACRNGVRREERKQRLLHPRRGVDVLAAMESAREERKQTIAAVDLSKCQMPQWSPPEKSGSSGTSGEWSYWRSEPQWSPPEKSGSSEPESLASRRWEDSPQWSPPEKSGSSWR